MKKYYKNNLIVIALLLSLLGVYGCGNNQENVKNNNEKTQFSALLEDFTSWENTEQRIENRHQNIVLPIKKYYDEFLKLSSNEQLQQAKGYSAKLDNLIKQIPEESQTIKMESHNVVYTRRYGVAVKKYIEEIGIRKNISDDAYKRDILDAWLGYNCAYNNRLHKKYITNLADAAIDKIKVGQSYAEIANLLQIPGERIAIYVSANKKDVVPNELNVWIDGDSYLLIRFQNGKAVEIKPNLVIQKEIISSKVNNPFEKIMARREVDSFEKQTIKPAKDACQNFSRDFSAFCKQNKDGKARNKKRVELAQKYCQSIDAIRGISDEQESDNVNVLAAKLKGIEMIKNMEAYLKANSEILDASPQVRSKAWRDNGLFYRKLFDAGLEYDHLKNAALFKDESYELVEYISRWLKNGHNYFHFSSAFKMPGKLLRDEMIKVNNKNIRQEVYLWSVGDAYCLVAFHNGKAVNIKRMGIW